MGMRHSNVRVGFRPDKSCMHIGRGALTESTLAILALKGGWDKEGGEQMEQRKRRHVGDESDKFQKACWF